MLLSVPDQQRLSETGASCHQARMSAGLRVAGMQRKDLLRRKLGNAEPVRFKVVDERDMRDGERLDQIARIQHPGQVGQLQAPIANRSRATEAGRNDILALSCIGSIASRETVFTTSSRLANSCAGNFWSRIGCRRPSVKLYSARWTFVPPTSPARIIYLSSKVPVEPEFAGAGSLAAAAASSKRVSCPLAGRMSCDGWVSG